MGTFEGNTPGPEPWKGLTLAELEKYPSEVLHNAEGVDVEPRVVAYELPQGRGVLKEWRPKRGSMLGWLSRRVIQREVHHYRLLNGARGIPRLLAVIDERAFVIEYIAARPIHRSLPQHILHAGLASLEEVLNGLHERRFAHLDMRHKGNILVDEEGRAWILDLGQGIDCSRGLLRRLIFPLLRRIDRSAVVKFRARYAPETLDPKLRDRVVAKYGKRGASWIPRIGRLLRSAIAP